MASATHTDIAQQPADRAPPAARYAAFISYSHRDRKWAEWLHRGIETYRLPRGASDAVAASARGTALRPVFLDRSELPSSSDLAGSIRQALEQSRYLIVICSPDSARSRWVNEEIRLFKALGRDRQVLCVIVAGEPLASIGDATHSDECFPPALRFTVDGAGGVTNTPALEPMAADVRPGKDDRHSARLKVIAGLLGVSFDTLRQREQSRRQRRLTMIAAASILGCFVFGLLAAAALVSRNEANRQRILADQQSLTARRTADFLKSLFNVSNPSEARGNSITAREVLDRGVQQVGEQLKDEPLVRADLTTTLGDVYTNLGLLKDAENLLQSAREIPSQPSALSARETLALGEVQYQRGETDAARVSLQQAQILLDASATRDPLMRARIDCAQGDLYVATQDYDKARLLFKQALGVASGSSAADREIRAHALEGTAQADFYDSQLDKAAAEFKTALQARVSLSGELHPQAMEITDALGSVEFMRGNLVTAADYYRRTLAAERRVLAAHDPEIGATLNNLGRILLEQRKFSEAQPMLQEALGNIQSQRAESGNTGLEFVFANLALTEAGLGHLTEAESLFQKGLSAAIASKHRLHGPILTDLADLECRTGRVPQGIGRLEEARTLVVADYPDDPWRAAHVDNVRAGCLTAARRYAEASRLIETSDPILFKKWRADTLYGYDALQRSTRLYALTGNAAKAAEFRRLAERR